MTALYPGSFDPVTLGHIDIAKRASALFDKVIIGVYATPSKSLLFDAEERIDLFTRSLVGVPNVEVRGFEGLVVRFAGEVGANVIVRGLRSGSDFEVRPSLTSLRQAWTRMPGSLTFTPAPAVWE